MSPLVQVSRAGRVLRITLSRPEKRNSLRVEDCRQLLGVLNEAELDGSVGAVLIDAVGNTFCSGMDLTDALHDDTPARAAIHEELFTVGGRLTKPVVAAVQGKALAGGMGLVTNAHVVVASEDSGFGLVEIRIGLWPFVVFRSVCQAIGERRALELSLTGRIITAQEALDWGLVHYVTPAGELAGRAAALAERLASSSPDAMRRGLDLAHRSRGLDPKEAVELAEMLRRSAFRSADFAEGVSAFFEKRSPKWPSLGKDPDSR